MTYEEKEIALAAGEGVVFYSDGIGVAHAGRVGPAERAGQ